MGFGMGGWGTGPKQVLNRMPVNPMDKSTIVSIIPKIITEWKPTLFPGRFIIPAAKPGDFELFIVEPSAWYLNSIDDAVPPTEIPVSSVELAASIVRDYCNGILLCDMDERMPGLFWIPGEYHKKNINNYTSEGGKSFQILLDEARRKQKNWYMALVQSTDALWAERPNPRVVSDDAKLAAEFLQLKDKPWMVDFKTSEMVNCKACGELVNPAFPVCKHCHAILDPARAKQLDIQFAAK